jgi:uncharacterized protein YdeI (YjbR/CyaY-like superfamily)
VKTNTPDGSPVRLFKSKQDWAAWLEKNHRKGTGLWLRLAKKESGLRSVSYKEALEVALCYGWIDGQKRPESEQTWLQQFSEQSWRISLHFRLRGGESGIRKHVKSATKELNCARMTTLRIVSA